MEKERFGDMSELSGHDLGLSIFRKKKCSNSEQPISVGLRSKQFIITTCRY